MTEEFKLLTVAIIFYAVMVAGLLAVIAYRLRRVIEALTRLQRPSPFTIAQWQNRLAKLRSSSPEPVPHSPFFRGSTNTDR